MSGQKLAGVLLVAVMVAVWSVRSFVLSDSDPRPATPTAPATPDDPPADAAIGAVDLGRAAVVAVGDVAGVPVGYPRSSAGAATAAVNWVASFPTLLRMGPIRLDDTLGRLLSQRTAAAGADEVLADYFTLIDELGTDFAGRVWIESPLQVDVTALNDASASVAVWALLVMGDPSSGPIEAVWRTHRIELVWERQDWRIDDVVIAEGPTPVASDAALPSRPGDFVMVDGWGPAVFAGTTTFGVGE